MNVRDTVRLIVVVVALTFVYFLLFPLASSIAGLGSESPASPAEQQAAAKWLLVVSVANVCVLAFLIRNSAIHGWRLALTISLVLFGVTTFMPQIETAVFVTFISPTTLLRIVAMGLIVSVL